MVYMYSNLQTFQGKGKLIYHLMVQCTVYFSTCIYRLNKKHGIEIKTVNTNIEVVHVVENTWLAVIIFGLRFAFFTHISGKKRTVSKYVR